MGTGWRIARASAQPSGQRPRSARALLQLVLDLVRPLLERLALRLQGDDLRVAVGQHSLLAPPRQDLLGDAGRLLAQVARVRVGAVGLLAPVALVAGIGLGRSRALR